MKNNKYIKHITLSRSILITFLVLVVVGLSSDKASSAEEAISLFAPSSQEIFSEKLTGEFGLSGEKALSAIEKQIDSIANFYGKSTQELSSSLIKESNLKINKNGLLFYSEPLSNSGELEVSSDFKQASSEKISISEITDAEVFSLHSKPASSAKIFLNFKGGVIDNTTWNYNGPINALPFSMDSDPSFSSEELNKIKTIWLSIAEDYSSFDVDVTTEEPTTIDANHYTQAIFTPSYEWFGLAGGTAFVGSFRWGDLSPVWIFSSLLNNNTKLVAEAGSHEIGHSMGLYHTAQYDDSCQYVGPYSYGSGDNPGWAPIMGIGYYKGITQWTNTFEHPKLATPFGCDSEQDDVSIITGTEFYQGDLPFAKDEEMVGTDLIDGFDQTIAYGLANVKQYGILTRDDTDIYRFHTTGGDINFSVSPLEQVGLIFGNADFKVRLLDSSMNVLAESNPDAVSVATVSKPLARAGDYYLEISSSGYLDGNQIGGYFSSGSMGQYQISGAYYVAPYDNISPLVKIGSPTNGFLINNKKAFVPINASAIDNVAVVKMEILIDGNVFRTVQNENSIYATWDARFATPGVHTILVNSYDAVGNVGSKSVSVTK